MQYISDAIREFEGTSEEVRVTVADSELAIARGDVEGALKKLRKVPPESPHYTKVRRGKKVFYKILFCQSTLSTLLPRAPHLNPMHPI